MNEPIVATFSIVGYDPLTKEWGIAVQSKFLAVGAICPYAQAGVGAIATQSYANTSFGPRGLKLLSEGKSAQEVVDILVNSDPRRSKRQLGIVDSQGNAATFTGDECHDWAGGITGSNFAAQGNILVSDKTVEAMAEVFLDMEGCLAERLLESLDAGQRVGGDSRGQQSAALLIVQDEGGYGGFNDRKVDLRSEEHAQPITELKRLYGLHREIFSRT